MDVVAARALLGVPPSADADQIKRAFRRLASSAHPDRGGSTETFRVLVDAQRLALAAGPSHRVASKPWATESVPHRRLVAAEPRPMRRRPYAPAPSVSADRFGDVLERHLAAAETRAA